MKQFDLSSALVDPSKFIINADDDRDSAERKYKMLWDMAQYMVQSGKVHPDLMVPGIYFFSNPSPETTISSTGYTSGIDVGLNGSLSAGTETTGGLGFSANYSNSETVTISDITIQVNTEAESQAVTNTYITKPIGSFTFPDGHDEKDVVNLIPLVARSDFNAHSVWCWTVPVGEAVRDNSDAGLDTSLVPPFSMFSYAFIPL